MKRILNPLTRLRAGWSERLRGATPRERVLLAGLAAVGAALIFTGGLRFTRNGLSARREASALAAKQEVLLADEPAVDEALRRSSGAGPGRTGAEVLAELDTLARAGGLACDSANPTVNRHGRVEIHRVRFSLRGATMEKLLAFDARLRASGEGMNVKRLTLESRDAGGGIAASYEVTVCRKSE